MSDFFFYPLMYAMLGCHMEEFTTAEGTAVIKRLLTYNIQLAAIL